MKTSKEITKEIAQMQSNIKESTETIDRCQKTIKAEQMVILKCHKIIAMEWINIEDKLPRMNRLVLVWRSNGYSTCRYQYSRNNWKFEKRKVFLNVHSKFTAICDDVTHWIYYPLPPNQEESNG